MSQGLSYRPGYQKAPRPGSWICRVERNIVHRSPDLEAVSLVTPESCYTEIIHPDQGVTWNSQNSCQGALTWPAGTFPLRYNISISVNIYWQLAAEQMLCDESSGNPNVTCLQKVDCLLEIQPAFADEKLQRAKSPRAGITRLVFVPKAQSLKASACPLSILVSS